MFSISEASSFYNRGETELRCVFADEGGDALLEFDCIEGDYRIELNGEIIGESGKTGYPQRSASDSRKAKTGSASSSRRIKTLRL